MQALLHSSRLVLRRFKLSDFDALFALTRQTEITDILPDWAMTQEQIRSLLDYWVGQGYPDFDPQSAAMLYAVCLSCTDTLIGWVGLWPKEGLDSPFPEVAYAISRDHRREGYCSEAVSAACAALFAACPNLPAIAAIVKDWNIASQGVVEKAGFLPRGKTTLPDDGEFNLFLLQRSDLALRTATPDVDG
jgi:RimJ/RimL family protein N-acetyltransferase